MGDIYTLRKRSITFVSYTSNTLPPEWFIKSFKQISNGSSFASYDGTKERDYRLRSYQQELEVHMIVPDTGIAEGNAVPNDVG